LIHNVELDEKDFAAARAVISCTELESVKIIRSQFVSSVGSSPVSEVELTTTSRTDEETNDTHLIVNLDLVLRGVHEDKVLLEIKARIEIIYSIPENSQFTQHQLRSFAKSNGMLNAWPYWREFIQNVVQRAGLPPLTLPLFRVLHKKSAKSTLPLPTKDVSK
jgi:preprotein translocase subunit SecB